MKKKSIVVIISMLAFTVVFSKLGHSQEFTTSSVEVKSYQGIPYLSGGIGLDERDELKRVGKEYNLKLTFAVRQGNYLGDVDVLILDSSGKRILEAVSEGPWFFARLPAGRYTVKTQMMDKSQQQVTQVKANSQTQLNFFWK